MMRRYTITNDVRVIQKLKYLLKNEKNISVVQKKLKMLDGE
jgi:hypothetical protein